MVGPELFVINKFKSELLFKFTFVYKIAMSSSCSSEPLFSSFTDNFSYFELMFKVVVETASNLLPRENDPLIVG